VSWVATFHTFFPTLLFLLAFANLHNFASSFPFLLYSSCIHEQSRKKKESKPWMMRTHRSPPKKTPLKENLFSNWPWALSLSLSQWQGEHFFLVESFANKNFFVWANNYGCKPIHHDMACASHISTYTW
jgi:hypothetical protein